MITKNDLKRCDTEQPYIFISYSSKDQDLIMEDVHELQKRGYNIWLDEKMLDKTNPSWREQVMAYIRSLNCKMVLFYVSKKSMTSAQCYKEVSYTMSEDAKKRHRLKPVPIAIIDTEPIEDILVYYDEICEEIEQSNRTASDKDARLEVSSKFIEDLFDSNNERVRIHSRDWPDRKVDYYSDIEEVLPPRTHLSQETFPEKPYTASDRAQQSDKNTPADNAEEYSAVEAPQDGSDLPQEKTAITLKKNDIVTLGWFPQNADGSSQPIEWQMLDVDAEGKALLVSRYALACRRYHEAEEDVTWEACTLRDWLNGDFYNLAFSAEEKTRIAATPVTSDRNPGNGTAWETAPQDKVFLLSLPEASRYFTSDKARACRATENAMKNGAQTDAGDGNCCWWLRSPGPGSCAAMTVPHNGAVGFFGTDVCTGSVCVRPALWLNSEY